MVKGSSIRRNIRNYKYVYLLLLPGVLYYLIFAYYPMYGITLAFKEYQINKGIFGSPWVGLTHFKEIFLQDDFWNAFNNTLIISYQRLLIEFPAPIILALLERDYKQQMEKIFSNGINVPEFFIVGCCKRHHFEHSFGRRHIKPNHCCVRRRKTKPADGGRLFQAASVLVEYLEISGMDGHHLFGGDHFDQSRNL